MLTVILVAIAMALVLAHALELPGKRRLSKNTYLAVQPIYYHGFTIGGAVGEFGGLVALPMNNFWLEGVELKGLGAGFLSLGSRKRADGSDPLEWSLLRDWWEYSHVVRAGLGQLSLTLLAAAIVV